MAEREQIDAARRWALRAQGRSERSAAELLAALTTRFDEETAQLALEALARGGWLDDVAAATRLATRMVERDLLASRLVQERLRARGFDQSTIASALGEIELDETTALHALAARVGLDPARPQRLAGRLVRAGYDPEEVADLVQGLIEKQR